MRAVATRTNPNAPASCAPVQSTQLAPSTTRRPTALALDLSRVPAVSVQRKLSIGASDTAHEREADRVASQVMRKSDSCHCGGSGAKYAKQATTPLVQPRRIEGSAPHSAVAPPLVQQVINTTGRPLDAAARTFMEPRFGQPFDGVRVHTDGAAAESARSIHARAYTVGRHMVFGQGQYAPHSPTGRELIAHELAHVVQQGGGEGGVVQRAEVDDRSCAGLTDIETDVDAKVNKELDEARKAGGTPLDKKAFFKDATGRLAGSLPVGPIEGWIEDLGGTQSARPSSLSATKYSGAESVNAVYQPQAFGSSKFAVVRSKALIHSICVGADKVGHFFQQGLDYIKVMNAVGAGSTVADAESAGRWLEIQGQGLASTGVYSNADQAANRAGMDFWADLAADIPKFKFAIKNYITSKWNEQANPSFYEKGVGGVVWSNLLTGQWKGPFTSAKGTSAPIESLVKLKATATSVTGTYEWPTPKPTNKGKITTGTITQQTTSVAGTLPGEPAASAKPVSGVKVDFDWTDGTSKGKGVWSSVNEQTLEGTWGIGASNSDGGSWKLKKA